MALSIETFVEQMRDGMKDSSRFTPGSAVVVGIKQGTLEMKALRAWAEQTYLFLKEHARVFSLVYGNCTDEEMRPRILRGLVEETMGLYTNSGPHLPLLVRFCHALGINDPDQVEASSITEKAFAWWLKTAKDSSWVEGWGTWAFSNQRSAFGHIYHGLKENYNLPESALDFWRIHQPPLFTPEEKEREMTIMSKYLSTNENQQKVRQSAFGLAERWMELWGQVL